jgi:hypothetical protein
MTKEKFLLSEKYRLELRWKSTSYNDGACELKKAYFTGPALSIASRIGDNEYIYLDFFKQYFPALVNVYVAKFKWGTVIYNGDGTVSLRNAFIIDSKVNIAPKLKNNDYIVIDTSAHTVKKHGFNLVYKSYVIDKSGNMYKFK